MRTPRPQLPVMALVALTVAAGCTMSMDTGPTPRATQDGNGGVDAPGTATPRPTPDPTAAAEEAIFGTWRRTPAQPTPLVRETAETACRAQDAVRQLPVVVLDARGEGEVTVVFAGPKAAAVCHVTLAQDGTAEAADARPVAGYPDPQPEGEKLGVHDVEIVESGVGARTVLVGRVGADVSRVAAQFDDATWSNASMDNGWYAMWWPGREPALTVAAVNRRSEAVDGFNPDPKASP